MALSTYAFKKAVAAILAAYPSPTRMAAVLDTLTKEDGHAVLNHVEKQKLLEARQKQVTEGIQ